MQKNFDTVEEFWSVEHINAATSKANPNSVDEFRHSLGVYMGVNPQQIEFKPSGHQALEWLLKRLSPTLSKRKVFLPAFTCSVVQDAILSTGLTPTHYDFTEPSGKLDWEKLISLLDSDTGVIIITHFYGVPIDFRQIVQECRKRKVVIIEDCAHTLGGKIHDQMAGTLGDASIFSFNYDKPISLGWGGFALINNMQPFESSSTKDCRTPSIEEELKLLQHFVEAMKYRRLMIPYIRMPSSELPNHIASLPKKNFTPEEDVSVGSIQAELGSWALERYSEITLTRNRIARNLTVRLESQGWWVGSEVEPAWLKQRVRFDNVSKLQAVSRKAQSKGFRIGNFNWPRLLEGTGEKQFENALNASTHWADVPIHQNLGEGELSEISSLLNQG